MSNTNRWGQDLTPFMKPGDVMNEHGEIIRPNGDVIRKVLVPEPLAKLSLDKTITAWLDNLSDDWSRKQWEAHKNNKWRNKDDAYRNAEIVGDAMRLTRYSKEVRNEVVKRWLETGESSPIIETPKEWAASLTDSQLDAIWRILIEAEHGLRVEMEQVGDTLDPEDERWRQDYLDVLHERDKIESVIEILILSGNQEYAQKVYALRRSLDEYGLLWVNSMPHIHEHKDDMRLRRVTLRDGSVLWWADPVTFSYRIRQ